MFGLKGRLALVTGSSRGLGWSMANGLAAAGATVVLNGTNERLLEKQEAVMRRAGHACSACPFDVTREAHVQEAVAVIEREVGSIDILVNCAGINRRGPTASFDARDWDAVMDVNVKGAWLVAKYAVHGMMRRRRGKIINIASLLSFAAKPEIAAYATSKAGVAMLTKTMAVEWAPYNIQANAIAPGYFKTDFTAPLAADKQFDAWVKMRTPAARWGDPQELNGLAVFLASEASSFVTGQVIGVDGGWTANL
ncbi:MAG: SDR family oxidoreductase [Nitrospiraceae bacterium]|nr:SDR family oxidoreductase [Nitrospiraceae bacterium]